MAEERSLKFNVHKFRMQTTTSPEYVNLWCTRRRKGRDRCAAWFHGGGGEEDDTGRLLFFLLLLFFFLLLLLLLAICQ